MKRRLPQPRPSRPTEAARDDGRAALEFLGTGVVLLVPLVYLVLTLGAIQSASFAAARIAHDTADSIARGAGDETVSTAIEIAAHDAGLDTGDVRTTIACDPACDRAEALVTATVSIRVTLPLVPAIAGLDDALELTVESAGVAVVDRFRPPLRGGAE